MDDCADPTNEDRARWGEAALAQFCLAVGDASRTDDEETLADLLADLQHLAARNHWNWPLALEKAAGYYEEEAETSGGM